MTNEKLNKQNCKPPFLAELLMRFFFSDKGKFTTIGDMYETYNFMFKKEGSFKAKWWYRKEVFKSVFHLFGESIYAGGSMFQNYFKVAFRNLIHQKLFSLINISGLALGIACCALILQYIRFEISFDKYHSNAENIYRVIEENKNESVAKFTANTFAPTAPALQTDFPQIKSIVRILPYEVSVTKKDQTKFQEKNFMFVDSTMFNVFDYEFILGNKNTALQNPYSIVLTESSARKYFGDKNPLGQTLQIEGKYDFVVKAVIKNVPENSHFTFDMLASISSMREFMSWALKSWYYPPVYTYALVPKNYDISQIEKGLSGFVTKHIGYKEEREIHFQKMTDIHLYSDMENELGANSSIEYIYLLAGIALFILLIACVNFMNLTTARSEKRAKEIGLRKVIGAERKSIMIQFFGEAMFYAFVSLLTAVLLIEILKNPFNEIVGRNLHFDYLNDLSQFAGFIILTFLVGLISGSYPALFFSKFSPADVLKSNTSSANTKGSALFRKFLVGFQFVTSLILIMASFVISSQIDFIKTKKLGFNSEQTIIIPVKDELIQNNIQTVKESLLNNSSIINVTAASSIPGIDREIIFPINTEGMTNDEEVSIKTIIADEDFLSTLKMEIAEGRNFDKTFLTDKEEAFIINETAAKELGWENPVGKNIRMKHLNHGKDKSGKIIGVVKDFHWRSMHFKIDPLVLQIANENYYYDYMAVKIASNKTEEALSLLESKWNELVPHRAFEYTFLDENFEELFKSEQKLFNLFLYASGIAVFVACLGLFGLSSFITQQRSKEIGIRKVLGASVSNIVFLLSFDFMKPLFISALFGLPVSYLLLNNWLNDFAYRTNIGVSLIVFSLILLFATAVISVIYQAIKAAVDNPVNSIRKK